MTWSSDHWPPGVSFRHQETRSGFTKWSCYVITSTFSAGQLGVLFPVPLKTAGLVSRFLWAFLFLLVRSEEKVNQSARYLKRLERNGVSDQETYLAGQDWTLPAGN